jgi:Zn-dependent protease with chaperone function
MRFVLNYTLAVAQKLGIGCSVKIVNDPMASFAACYGGNTFTFNAGRLGFKWFDQGANDAVNALIIHELGHHYSGDHLSSAYYAALCEIGARLVRLAAEEPEFFKKGVALAEKA